MAVTAEFLSAWAQSSAGPWLHHVCRTREHHARVLAEGLLCAQPSIFEDTPLSPRAGHVYLSTGGALERVATHLGLTSAVAEGLVVSVDARALEPAHLSPDEDCCIDTWGTEFIVPLPGAACPVETVRDYPWLLAEPDDAKRRAARLYRSYGEWAEAVGLGHDVEHTRRCWEQVGSLAHRGPIHPQALQVGVVKPAWVQ